MEKQNIYESLMAINKEVDAIKKDKKNEQRKRTLIPILAVIILYLCSYTKECNTLQNWGYLVGLAALIGLGIIIYKYSK